MLSYLAPVEDVVFILEHWLDVRAAWSWNSRWASLDTGTTREILDQAARFSADVLLPINSPGDLEGCRFDDGLVRTPSGYRQAYRQFVAGGWPMLSCAPEWGGQGLPRTLNTAVYEMLCAGSHGWAMYPGVAHGAYECIRTFGRPELQQRYLGKLVSGEWLATMCLTESTAGSDVGLLRTKAEPTADYPIDGSCVLTGTKLYISGGEHDLTDNIVHLVLARLPGAPAGSRGVSLFLVPKLVPGGAGFTANPVRCTGIESKMGLHGSATCTMAFERALGWLIGEPHRGLAAMLVIMNDARLQVAMQGLAHAEIAHQNALRHARQRIQSRAAGSVGSTDTGADPIIRLPSVQHLLLEQRARIQGGRALALWAAHLLDIAAIAGEPERRQRAASLASFLTPVLKSWLTESGFRLASTALQVYGGSGYVRGAGIEQLVRDSRVAMIYEGTNEVQAIDLVQRRLIRDGGLVLRELAGLMASEARKCQAVPQLASIGQRLGQLVSDYESTAAGIVRAAQGDAEAAQRVAADFLAASAMTLIAYSWGRSARAALALPPEDVRQVEKLELAKYYFEVLLPDVEPALLRIRVLVGRRIECSWLMR